MSKKAKVLIVILTVTVILGLGLVILRKVLTKKSSLETTTYTVRSETYENVIEISGTVSAAQSQSLQALSSGTVVGVYVQQGDYVKKGDLLVQLDDTTQQYNLAQHDYNMATKKINGSAKEIELMETQRLALVQKINECKVTATFDGVIANLKVSVGDSLSANALTISFVVTSPSPFIIKSSSGNFFKYISAANPNSGPPAPIIAEGSSFFISGIIFVVISAFQI